MKKNALFSPVNMALIGVMTAIGSVLYFWEIPLFAHLELDLSNVPAYLLGLVAGPVVGIVTEVLINVIHMFRSSSMLIGEIMNIGVGSVVILSMYGLSALISRWLKKDRYHAAVYFPSAVMTVAVAIVAGWLLNLVATPIFFKAMGAPLVEDWVTVYVFGSTLLNAVKTALCLLPFYPLVYAMARTMRRFT